jgi:hypothetical protein
MMDSVTEIDAALQYLVWDPETEGRFWTLLQVITHHFRFRTLLHM